MRPALYQLSYPAKIVVVTAFTRTHNSTSLVLRTGLEPVCPA